MLTVEIHVDILDVFPSKYLFFVMLGHKYIQLCNIHTHIYPFIHNYHNCPGTGDYAVLVFVTVLVVTGTHVSLFPSLSNSQPLIFSLYDVLVEAQPKLEAP